MERRRALPLPIVRLPVRCDRPNLDRATQTRRRDPRCDLDGGIKIVSLEYHVSAHRSVVTHQWTVCEQRLAVLHPDRRRVLRKAQREARCDAGRLVDSRVPRADRLLFVVREAWDSSEAGRLLVICRRAARRRPPRRDLAARPKPPSPTPSTRPTPSSSSSPPARGSSATAERERTACDSGPALDAPGSQLTRHRSGKAGRCSPEEAITPAARPAHNHRRRGAAAVRDRRAVDQFTTA